MGDRAVRMRFTVPSARPWSSRTFRKQSSSRLPVASQILMAVSLVTGVSSAIRRMVSMVMPLLRKMGLRVPLATTLSSVRRYRSVLAPHWCSLLNSASIRAAPTTTTATPRPPGSSRKRWQSIWAAPTQISSPTPRGAIFAGISRSPPSHGSSTGGLTAMTVRNFSPDGESGESRVNVPTGVLSPSNPLRRRASGEMVNMVSVFSIS